MNIKQLRNWYPSTKGTLFGYPDGSAKEMQTTKILGRRGEIVVTEHAQYQLDDVNPVEKQKFLAKLKELPPAPGTENVPQAEPQP